MHIIRIKFKLLAINAIVAFGWKSGASQHLGFGIQWNLKKKTYKIKRSIDSKQNFLAPQNIQVEIVK